MRDEREYGRQYSRQYDNRYDMSDRRYYRNERPAPPPQKRRKKRFAWWTVPVLVLTVCMLFYAYIFAQEQIMAYRDFQRIVGIVSGETFYPGVVVDGVDLGGKTMEEALALLSSHETASVQGFEVFLTADGKTWRLSSDEIPLSWNTETILQQAYALGRGGSLEDRYAAIQRLETVGAYYESNYTYDKAQVREITDAIAQELHIDGWDARVVAFDVANRSFAFSDEQVGRDVDADELYQTVIEQLDAGAQGVTIPVHMMEITPSVTRAQLEADYGLITSFTTKTTDNNNRNTNIRLAAEALNGAMVDANGGEISFNSLTGERTKEKGYKEAAAIAGGSSVQEVGGGVCQVATTMFNALLRANCEIVTRYPHAWPADYVPRGEDATVDWPGVDLVMRNDGPAPLFLAAWYEDRQVTVEVYGLSLGMGVTIDLYTETIYTDEVEEEDTVYTYNPNLAVGTVNKIKNAHEGYRTQTYKIWYQDGQETRREAFYISDYRKINPTYEYNDGNPPPTE